MANELYRQIVHLAVGLFAAAAAFLLPQQVFLWLFGVLLLLGSVIIFLFVSEFQWLFSLLERDQVAFIGKGAFFFGLGVFLTGLLFWKTAGMAILLLAIPDSAATIFGTLFHSAKLPYNHRKSILGSAVFFLAASLVLSFQYKLLHIFFIAFLLTALESFDYREIPFLDDNLVIPIVSAYMLTFI